MWSVKILLASLAVGTLTVLAPPSISGVATGWTGVDMSTPVFPEFDFLNSRNPLKKLWGGGLIFTHSEHSFPSLRTFISLIHSLIYSKFSGSLPHAGNSSILLRAHSKVKMINTNLRASMSDERLEHLLKVSIERDIANKIELDSLFELFETSGSWKLAL